MNHQKNALGEKILLLKKQSLTWPQIAAEIRYSPAWTCTACLVAALLRLSPEGDRVRITFGGKFLPYKRY